MLDMINEANLHEQEVKDLEAKIKQEEEEATRHQEQIDMMQNISQRLAKATEKKKQLLEQLKEKSKLRQEKQEESLDL